jgi:hypothetical protein
LPDRLCPFAEDGSELRVAWLPNDQNDARVSDASAFDADWLLKYCYSDIQRAGPGPIKHAVTHPELIISEV